jgi:hypothetical protein
MMGITKTKFLAAAGLLALLCTLWTPAVRADALEITLPTITGSAGDTIVVFGDLTNTGSSTLFFGTDTLNINPGNGAALQGTADLALNALLGIGPSFIGTSPLTAVDLFTIFIAADAAPGVYTVNSYNVTGGSDPGCADGTCGTLLGNVSFDVTVTGPVGVSEPSTLALLAAAVLATTLLLSLRRTA